MTEKAGELCPTYNVDAVEYGSQAYLGYKVAHDAFHVDSYSDPANSRTTQGICRSIQFDFQEGNKRSATPLNSSWTYDISG